MKLVVYSNLALNPELIIGLKRHYNNKSLTYNIAISCTHDVGYTFAYTTEKTRNDAFDELIILWEKALYS